MRREIDIDQRQRFIEAISGYSSGHTGLADLFPSDIAVLRN